MSALRGIELCEVIIHNHHQGYIFLPIRGQMGWGKKSAFEKEGGKIKDGKGRRKGREREREKEG